MIDAEPFFCPRCGEPELSQIDEHHFDYACAFCEISVYIARDAT